MKLGGQNTIPDYNPTLLLFNALTLVINSVMRFLFLLGIIIIIYCYYPYT
jgi:hypothetical protein